MSNLVFKVEDLDNGSQEIIVNAYDEIQDNLVFVKTGNTYSDDGDTVVNILLDILWEQENLKDQFPVFKYIAKFWGCKFTGEQEFVTVNNNQEQALLNLIQCISSVIGYCWSVSDHTKVTNNYDKPVSQEVKDRINYFKNLVRKNIISFSCAVEMILAYNEDQCMEEFMDGCNNQWLPVAKEFKQWRDAKNNQAEQQVAFRLLFGFNDGRRLKE